MKQFLVYFIFALAVISATILHRGERTPYDDNIGNVVHALKGAEKIIPPSNRLAVCNFTKTNELHGWIKYALAPRFCAYNNPVYDTLLSICEKASNDSLINSITTGRKILWANSDQNYLYYLTSPGNAKN